VVVVFALGCTPTGPSVSQVCTHIMDVLRYEFAYSEAKPSEEDLTKLTRDCVRELEKEQEKLGPERFHAVATCVMKAETMDSLRKCDDSE
jgi:hypothetical protein